MLARSRFNQVEECDILLSKLTSKDKKSVGIHTFYEWINPITDEGGGAYPLFSYDNRVIEKEGFIN